MRLEKSVLDRPGDTPAMLEAVAHLLLSGHEKDGCWPDRLPRDVVPSAVLFLMGPSPSGPCLILNKRSRWVRQPGDLCCPGGSISFPADRIIARLLEIPGVVRGPLWRRWQRGRREPARRLRRMLATALREGVEEMRLNPLGVTFLGPLPVAQLYMFKRAIYPLACWVDGRQRFSPNWEVDRIVSPTLRTLLSPECHARCRLRFSPRVESVLNRREQDFPCVMFESDGRMERLWGATYRVTMSFLKRVFDFDPPPMEDLPLASVHMKGDYLTGDETVRG